MEEPMIATPRPLVLRALPWLLLAHAAASLWHFAHNGAFLHHYPNLPASWSPQEVYAAGGLLTLLGLAGFLLYRAGWVLPGLALLVLYASTGFDGLLHYTRAPPSHHTLTMNLTICTEAITGALLLLDLIAVARHKLKPAPARCAAQRR
jgi:hypothetical protein